MRLTQEELRQIVDLVRAETDEFVVLLRLAGLDPRRDLRGGDLRAVDFGTAHIAAWDLSHTDLTEADLSRTTGIEQALLTGARKDRARFPPVGFAGPNAGLIPHHADDSDGRADAARGRLGDPAPPIRISDVVEKVHAHDPEADTSLIDAAYVMAMQAHGSQKRDNGDPYITHPVAVADILAGYRLDTASIAAGLLHDVISDTPVTRADIEARFGKVIAGLVDGVTKLNRLERQSDRTRQAESFRKLVLAMSGDLRVLLVKLADRLHTMRTLHVVAADDRRQRIARDAMEIYAPLAERIGMDALRTELETIGFATLEPAAFDTVQAALGAVRGEAAGLPSHARRGLARVCAAAGVDVVEVTGGEQAPFAMWRRAQTPGLFDALAFRIVVPTEADCYAALGAVHGSLPVIAGRFEDGIAAGKTRGGTGRAFGLWTSVSLPDSPVSMRIQILTPAMKHAEEHPADRPYPIMRELLKALEDAPDAENLLHVELHDADNVFCFTPEGQLIQLPRGATPVDFAYAVHTRIGDRCVGAKVNGRLMPLRHVLQNGDQIEIMTAPAATPSEAWLRHAVTRKARASIRRFIRQQKHAEYRELGRAVGTKAFRAERLDGSDAVLNRALASLKLATLDDLLVAVGRGAITPREVMRAAYPELPQFAVTNLAPGVATTFATCCHPVPGDRIAGVRTSGRTVVIHRQDCRTLQSVKVPLENLLDLDWDSTLLRFGAAGSLVSFTGRISVVADDDPGTLAALTDAVAKHDGLISGVKVVSRDKDTVAILMDTGVRDLPHLFKIIGGLRAAPGTRSVERVQG